MLSTFLIVSSLTLGQFPEVPVAPAEEPIEEEAAPEDLEQAARDRAMKARDDALNADDEWAEDEKKRRRRAFELRALATLTLPLRDGTGTGDFLLGARGELDIGFVSALFIWDRQGFTPISLSETLTPTSYWNGLLGASVWATRNSRIRVLGGVSAVNDNREARFGPTLGATVRLGIPIISIEGAALYTPVGFQQFDGRIEAVLRLLIFELRGGYRGRWIDTERSFNRPAVEPSGGPTLSLGLVF